jgi:DNA polymerase-3 subunit epsilon
VGHHVSFDVKMINEGLKRMGLGKLKIEVSILIDVSKFKGLQQDQHAGLDELCGIFKIQKSDRHTAIGDAYISINLFST